MQVLYDGSSCRHIIGAATKRTVWNKHVGGVYSMWQSMAPQGNLCVL